MLRHRKPLLNPPLPKPGGLPPLLPSPLHASLLAPTLFNVGILHQTSAMLGISSPSPLLNTSLPHSRCLIDIDPRTEGTPGGWEATQILSWVRPGWVQVAQAWLLTCFLPPLPSVCSLPKKPGPRTHCIQIDAKDLPIPPEFPSRSPL